MRSTGPIMVVDDDDDVRKMLCVVLEGEGYTTVGAADGIEALERMRGAPPALVLVDLTMPRMGGEGLSRSMKDDASLADIPIAIISGQTHALPAAVSSGTTRLVKPVLVNRPPMPVVVVSRPRGTIRSVVLNSPSALILASYGSPPTMILSVLALGGCSTSTRNFSFRAANPGQVLE